MDNEKTEKLGLEEPVGAEIAETRKSEEVPGEEGPGRDRRKAIVAAVVGVALAACVIGAVALFAQPAQSGAESPAASASSSAASSQSASAKGASASSAATPASTASASSKAADGGPSGAAASASGQEQGKGAPSAETGQNASQPQESTAQVQGGGSAARGQEHVHDWVPVTERVKVADEVWGERPIYETEYYCVCNYCGADCTADPAGHLASHAPYHASGGEAQREVQVGTEPYLVSEARYEDRVTGYRCSTCGAEKGA